jgi:predicted thioesterase
MAKTGDSLEFKITVEREHLASSIKSGCLDVLATPAVVALMEFAALQLAEKGLPEGISTVGTAIAIDHCAPAPLGAEVTVRAVLTNITDGRFFDFDVEVSDKKEVLAKGTHSRASVKSEKFQQKADSKYEEI